MNVTNAITITKYSKDGNIMPIVMMRYTVVLLSKTEPESAISRLISYKDTFKRERKYRLIPKNYYRDPRDRTHSERFKITTPLLTLARQTNPKIDPNLRVIFGSADGKNPMQLSHGATFEKLASSPHFYSVYLDRYIATFQDISEWLQEQANEDLRLLTLCPRRDTLAIRVLGHGDNLPHLSRLIFTSIQANGKAAALPLSRFGLLINSILSSHAPNTNKLQVTLLCCLGASARTAAQGGLPAAVNIGLNSAIEIFGNAITAGNGLETASILPCVVKGEVYELTMPHSRSKPSVAVLWDNTERDCLISAFQQSKLLPVNTHEEIRIKNDFIDLFTKILIIKNNNVQPRLRLYYTAFPNVGVPYPHSGYQLKLKSLERNENILDLKHNVTQIFEIHTNILLPVWKEVKNHSQTPGWIQLMAFLGIKLLIDTFDVTVGDTQTVVLMLKTLIHTQQKLISNPKFSNFSSVAHTLAIGLRAFFEHHRHSEEIFRELEHEYLRSEYTRYMDERPPDEF